MPPPLDLSVVIPAYNEAAGIGDTLAQLIAFLGSQPWTWELRVVDDGSTDETAACVAAIASAEPGVVLQRVPHGGKGAAVRAGMQASAAAHRFLCDADLSMPVHELPRFMPPALGGAHVAIGTREGAGARRVGEPALRHLAGRGFNFAVRSLVVPGIQDTQCGFKMFTAEAADAIFPFVTVTGWAFDIEVLHIARRRGFTIREVPIEWHFRPDSRVRLVRDSVAMMSDVLRIRVRALRGIYDGTPPLPQ
jgi:glycosyltransferase involved in cell wall biosynthesis